MNNTWIKLKFKQAPVAYKMCEMWKRIVFLVTDHDLKLEKENNNKIKWYLN